MAKSKKKLLVTTSTFPRFKEDAVPARFVLQLCEQFTDRYAVSVLTPHDPGAQFREKFGEIEVFRFPYFYPTSKEILCDGRGILPNMRGSFLGKIQLPSLLGCEYFHVRRLIHTLRPDIIHSHWAIPQGLCAALAQPKMLPHILTIHSSDLHTLRRIPMGRAILRYVSTHCHTIFFVSSYLKNMFTQIVPDASCTLKVLPMGVDHPFFGRTTTSPAPKWHLLYIGKMYAVKGVTHLIEAMNLLSRSLPQLKLTLVGDGEDRPKLEVQARTFDPEGTIISFTGQVAHEKLPEYLRSADALIVPSIITKHQETEGMPTVILEALATGTPVLASLVGGLTDAVIHGKNGLLFRHSDPADLAEKIMEFYAQQLWRTMPDTARNSAKKYAWPEIGRHYTEAFETTC
ncbi:MAG TPA: hypothetical protein DEQ20_10545 [Desulfobulbaceae bacterium]|nr:MAG: hypothetical protein A2520_06430 [Deltaproteobacteria bacterium RIFOXYD12_FULL_53_23]HCC55340.1 hypothetical protein [Desulfobulbaceae bacterium]